MNGLNSVLPPAGGFQQPSGLLPTAPPARAARWLAVLLLGLALAVALFTTLVRLPEVVVARFELVSADAADVLQTPIAAELVRVTVVEGDRVDAGDVLFELTSANTRQAQSQLRQLQEQQQALGQRARQLDLAHEQALALQLAEIDSATRELGFREELVTTQRQVLDRAERLGRAGVVAEVELLKYRLALAEAEKERVLGRRDLERLNLARQQLISAREQSRAEDASASRQLEERVASLQVELADSDGAIRRVRAPFPGTVVHLPARTPGSVVELGATLAQLARTDGAVHARLLLPERSLARLQVGQELRLQFDAYPYQRYGSVDARVHRISPMPLVAGNRADFVADATLTVPKPFEVRVGMRGQARIVIGQRTLLQRALDPLRGALDRMR